MNINRIEVFKLNIGLTHPTRIPIGIIDRVSNVIVKITVDSGIVGWGEASPFSPITGDSQESNYETAKLIADHIKGKNALAVVERMKEINAITISEPSIRSAFDMALFDISAKCADMPLYQFLGGERRVLHTDLTIGLQDSVEETVARAQEILDDGFTEMKLKVGRPRLEDIAHVQAVRELVGRDMAIKIDANQGWSYAEAIAALDAMEEFNLHYVEQPLAAWDTANLRRLRDHVRLPICADESVFNHRDAYQLATSEAVDYFNIKLGKSGGIHTALQINAVAEAAGCFCMIGCFAESRLALSAAAHVAMARSNVRFLDLDSAYRFELDPVIDGMCYSEQGGGLIELPEQPGLGAEIDLDMVDLQSAWSS